MNFTLHEDRLITSLALLHLLLVFLRPSPSLPSLFLCVNLYSHPMSWVLSFFINPILLSSSAYY